jgi:N-acetylneuraminate lyase
MQRRPFTGIWPALVTPLTEAGEPDLRQLERLIDVLAGQGLDGLYILGSTGQWPLLGLDQRRSIADRVVQAAAGRIPVMVHVGAAATDDAIALARHAAKIGAAAISSVAPIYYPLPTDAVFEHYRRIATATDLPLFIYHLAGVTQPALDPREYVERLLALPHIAGMKITDRDLYPFGLIRTYAGDRLTLFSGADEVLCHASLSGADGAIGSFFNLWGPACRTARQAFVAGSFDTGRRFMLVFQSVIAEVLRAGSIWGFLRPALRLKYGIDIGPPRFPLGAADRPWTEAAVERLVARVDDGSLRD